VSESVAKTPRAGIGREKKLRNINVSPSALRLDPGLVAGTGHEKPLPGILMAVNNSFPKEASP
jgi:hypothetical protein